MIRRMGGVQVRCPRPAGPVFAAEVLKATPWPPAGGHDAAWDCQVAIGDLTDDLVDVGLGPLVTQTNLVPNALLLYGTGPLASAWLRENAIARLSETFGQHGVGLTFTSRASIGLWAGVLEPTLRRMLSRRG